MRRWGLVWLSLVLLVLLSGMAVLQYRWLGQVSAAERQRMQTSLEERASRFAADFDRDLARAFFWLQVDAEALRQREWSRYAERYGRWAATASHPQLVQDVWVFTAEGESLRYVPASNQFNPEDPPDVLHPLRTEAGELSYRAADASPIANWSRAVHEEIPALVAPVAQVLLFDAGPDHRAVRLEHRRPLTHRGVTVIRLDEHYIRTVLLPLLSERYFSAGAGIEYRILVESKEQGRNVFAYGPSLATAQGRPDAVADLFDVRLDALADLTAAARPPTPGEGPEAPPSGRAMIMVPHGTGLLSSTGADRRVAISVVRQGSGTQATTGLPGGARWRLVLHHRAGSLDAAVGAARRRSLALSGGVLALLATSIVMLVVSTQRASRLAAQQMAFVAAVSHELRTPLAIIQSAGENLADGVVITPERVRRYGDLVRQEGRRLSTMVEQVLAIAGVRAGDGLRRRREPVAALIERALEASAAELEAAGLRVERQIPEGLPDALVDPDSIVRALANLLVNAAKYARNSGCVSVAAAAGTGREIQITVADRGPGVAQEDLPHIFEPFYRAGGVVGRQIPGSGLGLSLVEATARAHGGRVTVQSVTGEGASFTLHLPRAEAASALNVAGPLATSRS